MISSIDPDNEESLRESLRAALDLDFLDRQTFSDHALQRELLQLLVGQCERLVPVIVRADEAQVRTDAAHTLAGAAGAVGAVRVAAAAARIEAGASSDVAFADLDHAVRDTRTAIAAWLAAAAGVGGASVPLAKPGSLP